MMETWRHHSGGGGKAAAKWQQGDCVAGSGRDRQSVETEVKDSHVARKVLKADREKLRRDRLNEQFLELGKALDPDRPKNDKATILIDTVQILKDLTTQVGRLKAEYTSLSDESLELTEEKNELREEKVTLKSDIDSLNAQYQQRLRTMIPWSAIDPFAIMGPPPHYPYAVPMTVPPGPIPVHPSLHPYPFFPNAGVPNACPPFLSSNSPCNTRVEAPPNSCMPSSHPQPSSSRPQTLCLQDSRSKASNNQQRNAEKAEDFSNVATELELKTPGSTIPSCSGSTHNQESCSKRREQPWASRKKRNGFEDASNSSRCSSSHGLHDCSSESVGDGSIAEN